jgi:predicted AlkP superfamily phosphohydrolase/phosphomutase
MQENHVPRRPVVMIGLDAFDSELAATWAEAGELPTLARLFGESARASVRNPYGLFVGALWASFASAQRPDRHGFHCWDAIDPATYKWRLNPPRPSSYAPFWRRLGEAGLRVAAIDVPHARAAPLDGIELFEWGCHDRHFGLHSWPPGLVAEAVERFGLHPVLGIEPFRRRDFAADDFYARRGRYRTAEEEGRLTRALCEGARRKGLLLRSLLAREAWDLWLGVFGESHAVGHQQWHLHDEAHPRFDAGIRESIGGDPVLQLYRAVDEALGALIDALPSETTLLVHLSHGMTAHHDGTHLLDEVLERLDGGGESPLGRAVKPALPSLQHLAARAHLPPRLRSAVGQWLRGGRPGSRARRRFFAEPNNSVYGGIRFNLEGREPRGRVAPAELPAVTAEIERGLKELVNVATGGPVVLAVEPCARHHRRSNGDSMPDLFVEWERSVPIERVRSPRIGTVHTRYSHWRTGDHSPVGLLLARGEGFAAGARMPELAVEDIGPSIAARMGVALSGVDGAAAPWLADGAEAEAA